MAVAKVLPRPRTGQTARRPPSSSAWPARGAARDPMRANLNGDGFVRVLDLSNRAAAVFNGSNSVAIGAECP